MFYLPDPRFCIEHDNMYIITYFSLKSKRQFVKVWYFYSDIIISYDALKILNNSPEKDHVRQFQQIRFFLLYQRIYTRSPHGEAKIEIMLINCSGVYHFVYHLPEKRGTQSGTRLLKSEKSF